MQAHFNRRYDLRSSRKRTRTEEQEEELLQKEAPAQEESSMQKATDKGKQPLNKPLQSNDQIPSSSKVVTSPNAKPMSKEAHPPVENKESKEFVIEKSPLLLVCKNNLKRSKF